MRFVTPAVGPVQFLPSFSTARATPIVQRSGRPGHDVEKRNVAFGLKAHSGWSALVVLGTRAPVTRLLTAVASISSKNTQGRGRHSPITRPRAPRRTMRATS